MKKRLQEKLKNKQSQVQKASEQFQTFWDSMSTEEKRQFLGIRVQDLRDHLRRMDFPSKGYEYLMKTLDEAIVYGGQNKNNNQNCCEVWLCPRCNEIMTDSGLQESHVREKHMEPFQFRGSNPISEEWAKMISDGTWTQILPPGDGKIKIVEKIQNLFLQLIQNGSFAASILESVINYANEELRLIPNAKLVETLSDICHLDATQLNGIRLFLASMSHACDKLKEPDSERTLRHAISQALQVQVVKEEIGLSKDRALLVLDQKFIIPNGEFGNWLFSGASLSEELSGWKRLKGDKKKLVEEFCMTAEEFKLLQPLYDQRDEILRQEETLRSLELLCTYEAERRAHINGYNPKSYKSILGMRKKEITGPQRLADGNPMNFELETLDSIINGAARDLDVDRFRLNPELATTRMKHWFETLKSGDILDKFDALAMFQLKQKMNLAHIERNRVQARIERISFVVQLLSDLFKQKSGLDYRSFLLPLLKSFLKEKLQAIRDRRS